MRYWEESVPAYRAFFERVDNGFPRWNDTDKPLCLKDPFADIKPLTFPRMR